MIHQKRKTLGLAFSGAGNRSSFYIGFLEVLDENEVPVDYIAACSGGALVAAAYACGTLPNFKKLALNLNFKTLVKKYFVRAEGSGGLYSLKNVLNDLEIYTKNMDFSQTKTKLVFGAVDINSGEKVTLCVGSIAQAAAVSCSYPGLFEPVQWGNKSLVDGGLLTYLPTDILGEYGPDVTVGITLQGAKYMFGTEKYFLKMLMQLVNNLLILRLKIKNILGSKDDNGVITVFGKSLDIAYKALKKAPETRGQTPDILVSLPTLKNSKVDFSAKNFNHYYEEGRKAAQENLFAIKKLLQND